MAEVRLHSIRTKVSHRPLLIIAQGNTAEDVSQTDNYQFYSSQLNCTKKLCNI